VFANELLFYSNGKYKGFRKNIPLWKNHGKTRVALQILKEYPGKNIVIGDGISYLELGLVAGTFVYYGGHVWRENVAMGSSFIVKEKDLMKILDLIDP
jgi:phosphoserine phosphatase